MSKTPAWIFGAPRGSGSALAAAPPGEEERVIDISRSGAPGLSEAQAG